MVRFSNNLDSPRSNKILKTLQYLRGICLKLLKNGAGYGKRKPKLRIMLYHAHKAFVGGEV